MPAFPKEIMSFLPMIIIFILFWMLLIRPQQKKLKLHNDMLAKLAIGDRVITTGGIFATVIFIEEQKLELEISKGINIKCQRSSISGLETV